MRLIDLLTVSGGDCSVHFDFPFEVIYLDNGHVYFSGSSLFELPDNFYLYYPVKRIEFVDGVLKIYIVAGGVH